MTCRGIAQNLPRIPINGRRVTLYTDTSGRGGVEYPIGVGPIDILAVDDSGNFVVFELKLERGPDRALGQLARYMGWVKLNLAREREVGGVVVAKSIDERLRYAACVIPNVALLEYEVEFRLREVDSIER
jgi:RecB family endonuclease NucS